MKLTEHFTLEEMTRSATAARLGIDNTPSQAVIASLRNLCQQVLEPLRQAYGKPITVTSGFRSPRLNKAVGGVQTSQHLIGEAADIVPTQATGNEALVLLGMFLEFIQHHCAFDQLIVEHNKQGTYWLHVSCKADISKNRRLIIYNLVKK